MKKLIVVPMLAAAMLTGCAQGHSPPKNKVLPPSVKHACPPATHLEGSMGACSPEQQTTAPAASTVPAALVNLRGSFPDLSNNDPCLCAQAIRAHGHPGEILKVNQGVGFIDQTFGPMAADAKRHRLCVGGYDFDQDYTAAEAYTFVAGLHRAGIYKQTACSFPPTLDVEFGLPSKEGLEHQLAVLHREYGRAWIYTGQWYWQPHFGCWLPKGVREGWLHFWLSGYPRAAPLCGLRFASWASHQYTDHGFNGGSVTDMSVYLHNDLGTVLQLGVSPATLHAARVRALERAEALRRALHGDIDRHRCRPGQHATPARYHSLCGRWLAHGKLVTAEARKLREQLHAGPLPTLR